MMEFVFEDGPWEQAMAGWKDSVPASQFLALLEEESEETVQEALQALNQRNIKLDISQLPKPAATGEAAIRLRREEQLVKKGDLLRDLEETDPLRIYLEELAQTPACGDPVLLAQQAFSGDDSAKAMLVNVSMHRVIAMAQEMTGHGVLLMDLIQEGSLGLWEAILNWQGSGDFEAHRDWWIYQSMAAAITLQARANGVGQKMRDAMEDYRSVDEKLLTELGRNPTLEEIAEEMHMSVQEAAVVADMLENAWAMHRTKAEAEPKAEEPDDEQAVEDTAYFQMRQRITELLSNLEKTDTKLLTLRFGLEGGLPLSPEETGKRLALTPEEVVAREAAALAKLRNEG